MVPSVSVIGSVADSGFNPTWIQGLQWWYDAADRSTLFNNSTGSVLAAPSESIGRWEDKSPNRWHATQSSAPNRPIRITGSLYNGLDTIRFNGSNSFFGISQSFNILTDVSESTFFVVSTSERKATNNNFFIITTPNAGATRTRVQITNNGEVRPLYRRLDSDPTLTPNYARVSCSGSAMYCITIGTKYNTSSSYFYGNGVTQFLSGSFPSSWSGSTSNTTSSAALIGCFNSTTELLQGNMGELISYSKYLNDAERRAVERYLLRKWNIRSYDQKTSSSIDIFSNLDLYLDANNSVSNPGSGSTWFDLSGNGRNGTLRNGAVFGVSQSISYVDLDGTNDDISCGNVLNYTSQDFSISCWVRVTSGNSSTFNSIIFSNTFDFNQGYLYYIGHENPDAQQILVSMSRQSGVGQTNTMQTTIRAYIKLSWIFVTLTRSASIVRMYLNGVYAQSTDNPILNPASSIYDFTIGTYNGSQPSPMRVGAVIAHSKRLSDQEVLELYNFTKRPYNITD